MEVANLQPRSKAERWASPKMHEPELRRIRQSARTRARGEEFKRRDAQPRQSTLALLVVAVAHLKRAPGSRGGRRSGRG